ncbi:MAG: glycosyltransferase family 2 protein [Candidatus Omnitrophica bacterium]|nr:glycosyltransferase family 2 protein [Candidatus Omnitrophota bacterium]
MDTAVSDVSVIIVNWNTKDLLRTCLRSVYETTHAADLEVLVVDNASSDGSVCMVEQEFSPVKLLKNEYNIGHTAANNQAIKQARSPYILLVNSDVKMLDGCIDRMKALMDERPQIAALSARSLDPGGKPQADCRRFPKLATALFDDTCLGWWFPDNGVIARYRYRDWQHNDFRRVEQPPLTCFMVRKEVFDRIGLFDERFFLYFNDPDFCYRMQCAGLAVFYTPEAQVVHFGGASIRQYGRAALSWQQGRLLYYRKHFGRYAGVYVKIVLCIDLLLRAAKFAVKKALRKAQPGELSGRYRLVAGVLAS